MIILLSLKIQMNFLFHCHYFLVVHHYFHFFFQLVNDYNSGFTNLKVIYLLYKRKPLKGLSHSLKGIIVATPSDVKQKVYFTNLLCSFITLGIISSYILLWC